MAPTPRPAAELLAEETKVFERLLALCVEHSLPPQIPRFIARKTTESSLLPVMRAVAPAAPRPAPHPPILCVSAHIGTR